jgi:hypothetical protein
MHRVRRYSSIRRARDRHMSEYTYLQEELLREFQLCHDPDVGVMINWTPDPHLGGGAPAGLMALDILPPGTAIVVNPNAPARLHRTNPMDWPYIVVHLPCPGIDRTCVLLAIRSHRNQRQSCDPRDAVWLAWCVATRSRLI